MKRKALTGLAVTSAFLIFLSGCGTKPTASTNVEDDKKQEEKVDLVENANAAAGNESTEVTYESHIKEIVAQNCLSCHGDQSPTLDEFNKDQEGYAAKMKGPRFDSYESLVVLVNGTDAGAIMRRLDDGANTKDGNPGNMYQNLGKTDEERAKNLELFKQWAGSWSLKKSNELTPEERAAITAPEKSTQAAPVTYENHVKEIIAQNCLSCHGDQSPTLDEFNKDQEGYAAKMKGPRFDSYESLVVLVNGTDAGAIMRRLDDGANTKDGNPGNMYHNLGKTDEERAKNLAILKEWAGSWSLKKSNELTDEERAKITAPEK